MLKTFLLGLTFLFSSVLRAEPVESTALVTSAVLEANQIRHQFSLPFLAVDPLLTAIAQRQAEDMQRRQYFSHETPEGLSPFDRMERAGIHYRAAAENIAEGVADSHRVFSLWLASPGHRQNLLNKLYSRQGIGFAGGFWVHDFTN